MATTPGNDRIPTGSGCVVVAVVAVVAMAAKGFLTLLYYYIACIHQ